VGDHVEFKNHIEMQEYAQRSAVSWREKSTLFIPSYAAGDKKIDTRGLW